MKNFKLTGSFTDREGNTYTSEIRIPYLVKFVDPEKEYIVPKSLHPSKVIEGFQKTKGEDLTQNEITYLFFNHLL